jgi:hypothetical protein
MGPRDPGHVAYEFVHTASLTHDGQHFSPKEEGFEEVFIIHSSCAFAG